MLISYFLLVVLIHALSLLLFRICSLLLYVEQHLQEPGSRSEYSAGQNKRELIFLKDGMQYLFELLRSQFFHALGESGLEVESEVGVVVDWMKWGPSNLAPARVDNRRDHSLG